MRAPVAGNVKTRLVPPLTPEGARDMYLAFLQDVTAKLRGTRLRPTVFLSGGRPADLGSLFPAAWPVDEQHGETLGDRLANAFGTLLETPGARAVIIGSDSPDLPLVHVKRAFRLLKHRDVVLGPTMDGGYYLIGLRAPAPSLFRDIPWGSAAVLERTVRAARDAGLALGLTPPWYDVDDAASLALLRSLCAARRVAGGERLVHTERFFDSPGAGD
ncbi:MAG TPA: TIGR04282 family arsenosugar biosynthesis glycosyltransferase [Candidatus Krumholzibacteria bacterium]|nr:TIGR04282 family arsenosugar biosynthesis glycosyltransferase [Candidatus Krumholzibacteria bacterium]